MFLGVCSSTNRRFWFPARPDWKPTPLQETLLKAAFFRGEMGLEAWENWKHGVDIEKIDDGSQRLLPLVYKNLLNCRIHDGMLERLKGVYKKTWFVNQTFLHQAAQVIPKLHDCGIPVLLLKGMALALVYYPDSALRPMTDVDIMVPWLQAEKAGNLLKSCGYRFKKSPQHFDFKENFMIFKNGIGFTNDAGSHVDLHWSLLKHNCHPGADDLFWAKAEPVKFKGTQAMVLAPEHQLLQVLEHGAYSAAIPSLRWVADAFFVLTGNRDFDWEHFLNLARGKKLSVPVREMLIYLDNLLAIPIPESKMSEMINHRASDAENRLYCFMTISRKNVISRNIQHCLLLYFSYRLYLHEYQKIGRRNIVLIFLELVKFRWDLKRTWLVFLVFPAKFIKKTWGYLSRKIFPLT